MKLPTHGSLFDHACQIKDMKFSGFSPTTLRYTCNECGGHLVLRLDRERWEEMFGEKPSFRLSKKVLTSLEAIGAEPVTSDEEIEAATQEIASFSAQQKFHWEPSDDEEDEEEDDEE